MVRRLTLLYWMDLKTGGDFRPLLIALTIAGILNISWPAPNKRRPVPVRKPKARSLLIESPIPY